MRNKRKLKLTIETGELLKSLGIESGEEKNLVDVIIEVPESKELYKSLSRNDKIKDWDMIDDGTEEIKVGDPAPEYQAIKKTDENSELAGWIWENYNMATYNDLAVLIQSVLMVGYKSPALKFDQFLFNNQVKERYQEINQKTTTTELTVCRLVLEMHYSQISRFEALIDVIIKLKEIWSTTGFTDYPNLSLLIRKLYKN